MDPQGKDQNYRLSQEVQEAHQGKEAVGELSFQEVTRHGARNDWQCIHQLG